MHDGFKWKDDKVLLIIDEDQKVLQH